MDPVQITMLGVGVALAALIVTMNGSLRRELEKRIEGVEKRFGERFDGIDKRLDGMDKRFDGIDARLRSVEDGLSEVKGRLALVEKFILGRTEAAAEEAPAE